MRGKVLLKRFIVKYFIILFVVFNAYGLKISHAGEGLSIISWNVWFDGSTGHRRYPLILNELYRQDADILLLQEVTPYFIELMKQHPLSAKYNLAQSDQNANYQNITLTKQLPEMSKVLVLQSNMQRKALIVQLELPSSKDQINIVNVHLESPLDDDWLREQQLEKIIGFVEEDAYLLIGGDFNFGNGSPEESVLNRTFYDLAVKDEYQDKPTYDIERNYWAKQTKYWFEPSRRLDRFYHNLPFSVETKYSIFANAPVFEDNKYMSDHFGVRGDLYFKMSD
ncbi:endonuclease/exonuclease/phosphatase family protein [Amphritea japonica]|uniref:Endonuclease/exonuclease/phosphatase domain-containing protein n=1 Tax=Amphritea japonica ATCC BAA-1530 TaxID=1278309 RepID=A0A7R6P455_9GAMM|nr:endonuclease/exonuclease/phosphatase family protein [Amphritea japonica]BBB26734.1 conserved hypothetical protein [Amphritea japonica ATCC BAA-1530]